MKNEKGFLLMYTIFLIFLLCTGLVILSGLMLTSALDEETENICRLESSKTLQSVSKKLEELMALNEEARTLRQAMKIARAGKIVGFVHPAVLLIAKKGEKIIHALQVALDIKQKALIVQAQASLIQLSIELPEKIQKQVRSFQARTYDFAHFSTEIGFSLPARLAVKPDRPSEIAPIYDLKKPFTESQAVSHFWKIRVRNSSQNWSHRWVQINHTFPKNCRLSLKNHLSRFQVVILADRS